nr:hypothetical protein [Tanacetum cinerariifolium]
MSRKGSDNHKNKPPKADKGGHGKGKGKMGYAPNNAPFAPKHKTPPPPKKITLQRTSFVTNVGLRGSKKLKPCAFNLYVGDGHRAAVEAIETYHLELPSGLVIVLNNCYYAPSITRGVILVSRLFDDGFINRFDENNVISVSKNNLFYFMAVLRDGIFEIDMSCSNTNDSSMYAISNKRAKINLDSSLLWHCCLRHISKKHIKKLQHDGFLNSIDIESLGKYVSCLFGKKARKPYSHQVERAKDLLGLIHTDVCSPFRIVSKQGANYFVTFTDDFSRYGYVYLLKHKHEVFETFKSFWDYALETAARILNMVPTKKVDKTSYEIWHGQAPKLSYLKVCGCKELVKRDTLTKPNKLDPRSVRCIFVGYPNETMRYSLYIPSENKVFVARNAEFFENDLIDLKAIELPPNARTVGSKWLFRKKTDIDGAIYVFKARLVAKGFTQTYEVDYEETFSPVADIRAIRILIAIATYYNYEIWQMNVKTAFLNGHLSEEVYMEQPDGFVNPKYHNHNPGEEHWTAVKNILKYLRNTKDMFLVYGGNMKRELIVSCYNDAGYLTDADDLKSHTGYVFVLNGGVVNWKKAVWIHKFISGLGIVPTIKEPISMYCDNTGAITIVKYDGVTKGARHFRAKVQYLRETIKLGDVKIEKVDIDDNLADPFTKALAFPKHSELTRSIGMLPASSFM